MRKLVIAAAFALSACGQGAGSGSNQDLRQTSIPKDFTFQATRSVALTVTADDKYFGDLSDALLVVARPNGSAMYRGAIRKGEQVNVQVLAPSADGEVELTVAGRGGEGKRRLTLDGNGRGEGRID
jgi:hypothetical protein